jgi:ABC-type uncharacterized transport system permease subunit
MPLFWLRVALSLYGVGLLYAVVSLWGGRPILTRIMLPAVGLGTVFHFVSLVEYGMLSAVIVPSFLHQMESLLAFLLMSFFFVVYFRYQTASPGVAVFPMAFLLTVLASAPSSLASSPSPGVSNRWIIIHVGLILVGYTALFFSFFASILYLIQERNLKAKVTGGAFSSRLPALATIDEIGYKCLVFGFPFMTLGLIAGSILAEARFGSTYFRDPKILLSTLMWAVYMVLLYTRWSAGWRGRRAAYLAAFAFAAAVLAWSVNNGWHRFIAP